MERKAQNCRTGQGYSDLLFLLAVHLLLPTRSLSLQMLSMLECRFALCDHYSEISSPSGLYYWALVSVPNSPLGSFYSQNLISAEDKSPLASIWLYVLGFIHWVPWKPFDQSLCTAGGRSLQVKNCWCMRFLPTATSRSEQSTVAEKHMLFFEHNRLVSTIGNQEHPLGLPTQCPSHVWGYSLHRGTGPQQV